MEDRSQDKEHGSGSEMPEPRPADTDGALIGENDESGYPDPDDAGSGIVEKGDILKAIGRAREKAVKDATISIAVRIEDAFSARVIGYLNNRAVKLQTNLAPGVVTHIKITDLAHALESFDENHCAFRHGPEVHVDLADDDGGTIKGCEIIWTGHPAEPLYLDAGEINEVFNIAKGILILMDEIVDPTKALANARIYRQRNKYDR